jgi:hypothetical protein
LPFIHNTTLQEPLASPFPHKLRKTYPGYGDQERGGSSDEYE